MPEGAQQQETQNRSGLTMGQFRAVVREEVRNAGLDGLNAIEERIENIERHYRDWQNMSQSERTHAERSAFHAIMAGGTPESRAPDAPGRLFAAVASLVALSGSRDNALAAARAQNADERVVRALEASTGSSGGVLIGEEVRVDLIEALREEVITRRLGAKVVPMPQGNLSIPRQTGRIRGSWTQAEGKTANSSDPTFDKVSLSAKPYSAVSVQSQFFMRTARASGVDVDAIIMNDLLTDHAISQDNAFLRGTGAVGIPKGISNLIGDGQKFNANATSSLENIETDLIKAMYLVNQHEFMKVALGWGMNPRTVHWLLTIRTTDGYPIYMQEIAQGRLHGHQLAHTNGIPKNIGDGAQTEIYFGDFDKLVIGEESQSLLSVSDGATYLNELGVEKSAFIGDELAIKSMSHVDCNIERPEAFSLIEAVGYGKPLDA